MLQRTARRFSLWCLLILAACGGSSPSPTSPTPQPPPSADTTVSGTVVDAVTDQGLAGVTIKTAGLPDVTTAANGAFTLTYPGQTAFDVKQAVISAPNSFQRTSNVLFPGAGPIRPSLIPQSFNLAAFDQMFRRNAGILRRFMAAPTLVIERRVLAFVPGDGDVFRAAATLMSEAEAQSIVDDMSAGLPHLTGNAFPAFSAIRIETSAEGDMVPVVRSASIFVARATGVSGGIWRYYYNLGDFAVTQSSMLLEPIFETGLPVAERRALRTHYLGHALSWEHVDTVPSVMNSTVLLEPTDFDRVASKIAFQRMPGNQSPDVDLAGVNLRHVREARRHSGSH